MSDRPSVTAARIVQVAALPPGWHYDDWNRSVGIALVEIDTDDGETHTETFYLGEDLALVGAPDDIYYRAHYEGDEKKFAKYGGPDWEPAP